MGALVHRPWNTSVAGVLAASLVVVAACTSKPSPPAAATTAPGEITATDSYLVFRSAEGVTVVDANDGGLIVDAPQGVPSPDFTTIATASGSGGRTTISTLDAATGSTIASSDLPGTLELRAVSSFDGSVALTPPGPDAGDPWAPVPRTVTHITVAIPGESGHVERFDLHGNFEPEAFSGDGESLYMLEYRPALHPTTYRVTRLYLEKDKVWPVFGPDKRVVENMTATRLQQTLAPGGNTLYTLYTNQPPSYLSGTVIEDADEVAFVHTLDLRDGFAFCIELPPWFGTLMPDQAGIAAAPTGRYVYAVDAKDGKVAQIDAKRFEVVRNADVDLSAVGAGPLSVRVSPDGRVLLIGGSDGLVALDTDSMEPVTAASLPDGVTGLAYTDDGSLFVSWGGGVGRLDAGTLQTREVVPTPASGELESAETIAG